MKTVNLVIFRSVNGRDTWTPCTEHEVPAWVRAPDVLARLLEGEECMDAAEPPAGGYWYRALSTESLAPGSAAVH